MISAIYIIFHFLPFQLWAPLHSALPATRPAIKFCGSSLPGSRASLNDSPRRPTGGFQGWPRSPAHKLEAQKKFNEKY